MLVQKDALPSTTNQVETTDELRCMLEKQIEILESNMVNGYETLEQSVKRATQQISSIYQAMDRVEAIIAVLQQEIQKPPDSTSRTDIKKCEMKLV